MAIPATGYDEAVIANPGGALTNFTLLIDLSRMTADWWSAVTTSDGTKGRAAKSDGTTELACDWLEFDDGANTGFLRLKYSGVLASAGTQTAKIYPPQTGNSSYGAGDSFGSYNAYDANWKAYFPLQSDFADRTSNGFTGTANGGISAGGVSGTFGDATVFDGADDFISLGDTTTLVDGVTDYTLIFWINGHHTGVSSAHQQIFERRDSSGAENGAFLLSYGPWDASATNLVVTTNSGGSWWDMLSDGEMSVSTWTHISSVANTAMLYHFFNGATDSTDTYVAAPSVASLSQVIGGFANPFDGYIQDFQMHTIARSGDWVGEEYDQTVDNSTFWGAWSWNAVSGGASYLASPIIGNDNIFNKNFGTIVR